jgi:SAM-dependent methyltransferase
MDRIATEQLFHDDQAQERVFTFERDPGRFVFSDESYLDHETWIRPAFAALGDVAGLRVLDFGCGHGMASIVLARQGAHVTAFDLSPGYVSEARRRAAANNVQVEFLVADGQRLPFADSSFDRVWGNAILHHLELAQAGNELRRVLRPGGRAVFCEPWGENPLLNFARRRLPYPGKGHTPDERPLRLRDLEAMRPFFSSIEVHGHQLLSMLRRVMGPGWLTRRLQSCDDWLLRRFSGLRRFCRYAVLILHRAG